jgi:hypothetical protein
LGIPLGYIKLFDQVDEPIRDPLPDDIVVHRAELMADSGLNLGIEAALLFCILHDLIHASPDVKLMYFHGKSSECPCTGDVSGMANSKWSEKFRKKTGTFRKPGRKLRNAKGDTGSPPFEVPAQRE